MVIDEMIETLKDMGRFLYTTTTRRLEKLYNDCHEESGRQEDYSLDSSVWDATDTEYEDPLDVIVSELIEILNFIRNEVDDKPKLLLNFETMEEEKVPLRDWLDELSSALVDKPYELIQNYKVSDYTTSIYEWPICCRLAWYKNYLLELVKKTPEGFYGRRTDVMPYHLGENKLKEGLGRRKPLKELTQDEFNRLARKRDERDEFRAQTAISPAEKNNLYADIKDFEEEFRDLQATAERLPDSYINQICGTASYPFEDVIDEVQNVEDWCSEAEEFLKADINSWGNMREANLTGILARRGSRIGGSDKCFVSESDKTFEDEAGKKWIKGDKLRKSKASADSFESETKPTRRLNQMKKDGKLDKDAKIDAVEESIFDFEAQNQPMYRFAKQKHDATEKCRKHSGDPYWVHPEGVAKIAAAYGGTDIEIQAAMAHDTLEDTNCSYDELEEMFGDEVASIVREITNDTEEVDRLGKERYINLELISLSHPALFVKLCDMYYNQMDFPTEAQKQRMIKNINYLLANREDDLKENEIALIEDILQTSLS